MKCCVFTFTLQLFPHQPQHVWERQHGQWGVARHKGSIDNFTRLWEYVNLLQVQCPFFTKRTWEHSW
jgi:hypothetical protein